MTEWEVWYAGGIRVTSQQCDWQDLPYHGVLVVRAWYQNGNGAVAWGDSNYGHPDTWKGGQIVSDEEFQRVFLEAQATDVKPSER